MDRNDRRYRPLGLLVKQFSGRQVLVAVGFEMLSQRHPIHAVSAFINLDEVWQSSSVGDRLCRRDKRVWNCQYDIAGLTPAAISASLSASVPLLTPTQCRVPQ